jgi:hypothetical protein
MIVAVGGVAAVIVAAVFLVPTMRNGSAKQNQPPAASPQAQADTSTKTAAVPSRPVDSSTKQQAQEKFSKSAPAPKGQSSDPPASSQPSYGGGSGDVETQLQDLLTPSKEPERGTSVMAKLRTLEPQVKSSREIYLATTLRANVLAAKLDTTAACNAFKNALPRLSGGDVDDARSKMDIFCRQ